MGKQTGSKKTLSKAEIRRLANHLLAMVYEGQAKEREASLNARDKSKAESANEIYLDPDDLPF